MGIVQLVDRSAAEAMEQAVGLQRRLREASRLGDPTVLDGCEDEVHRLVSAIVSMRNAAELLKREVESPGLWLAG